MRGRSNEWKVRTVGAVGVGTDGIRASCWAVRGNFRWQTRMRTQRGWTADPPPAVSLLVVGKSIHSHGKKLIRRVVDGTARAYRHRRVWDGSSHV